jgi:hypothetical protein
VNPSTHLVHILAAVGSLMILIGSAGQARESLHKYQKELKELKEELGESFDQLTGAAFEIGRLYLSLPNYSNEIIQSLSVMQVLAIYVIPRIGRWLKAGVRKLGTRLMSLGATFMSLGAGFMRFLWAWYTDKWNLTDWLMNRSKHQMLLESAATTSTNGDPALEEAQLRMRPLFRTARNWIFIMIGSIVVFAGVTIDLITSWSS